MGRVLHRKRVCHVHHLHPIRAATQCSPPPAKALARSRWEQLPPANRHRLLQLLGRLVERQLRQPALPLLTSSEEAEHDLHR
jgi:hypothetical protein